MAGQVRVGLRVDGQSSSYKLQTLFYNQDYRDVVTKLLEQLRIHQKSKKQSGPDPTVSLVRMTGDPAVSFVRRFRDRPTYVNNHADAAIRSLGR